MRNVTIDVKHVTRVEGHGNIAVRVRDGEITSLQLQIVESPRFFESFMRGRPCAEAPHIACRICGICSVGHTTAAVKAVEAACGIVPSEQTVKLRKLLFYGEQIQSHVLHVLFLAVPDYLGAGSVIPLAGSHPETVKTALRLKRLANDLCAAVGGRHIHPIAAHVGGFTHVPRAGELIELKQRLVAARTDLAAVAALYAKLPIPDFERDTEYVALKREASVKELLGHKSLAMTLRYAHLAPGHKRKAVEMLDKVLNSGQSEKRVHNLFTFLEDETHNQSRKYL